MNVNELFGFIGFLARKNQLGSITPDEIHYALDSAQRSWFDHLIGKITTAPHVALGQDERISERLKPFKVTGTSITPASQIAAYPTDFFALTLMTDNATGRALQYVDDAKLTARLKSVLDPIDDADPGCFTNAATGWKIFPASITGVKVNYYRLPKNIVWAYTLDTNGRPVYNPSGITKVPLIYGGVNLVGATITFSAPAAGGVQAIGTIPVTSGVATGDVVMSNVGRGYAGLTPTFTIGGTSTTPPEFGSPVVSVQPEWDEISMEEILARTCRLLGFSFEKQSLIQFGQEAKAVGV